MSQVRILPGVYETPEMRGFRWSRGDARPWSRITASSYCGHGFCGSLRPLRGAVRASCSAAFRRHRRERQDGRAGCPRLRSRGRWRHRHDRRGHAGLERLQGLVLAGSASRRIAWSLEEAAAPRAGTARDADLRGRLVTAAQVTPFALLVLLRLPAGRCSDHLQLDAGHRSLRHRGLSRSWLGTLEDRGEGRGPAGAGWARRDSSFHSNPWLSRTRCAWTRRSSTGPDDRLRGSGPCSGCSGSCRRDSA